ncbi:hypothetical protein QZK41_10080 [Acinetobacter baumannii]|nr:hypothetical protein [Acinetobacter baumannii]MDN8574705.1 hypothetical protein [Acinetobacter baumannii]
MENSKLVRSLARDGLLRYFSSEFSKDKTSSVKEFNEIDIAPLMIWWALSSSFEEFINLCIFDSRKILPAYEPEIILSDGIINGVLQVNQTSYHQLITDNISEFYVEELGETWKSAANIIIYKILKIAKNSLLDMDFNYSFNMEVNERIRLIDEALNRFPLRELKDKNISLKFLNNEKRILSKYKNNFYKKLYDELLKVDGILNLDSFIIQDILLNDFLPKIEIWKAFELAVLYSLIDSISILKSRKATLSMSILGYSKLPIAKIDNIEIYWQKTLKRRPIEERGKEFKVIEDLYCSLEIPVSGFRTDILIVKDSKIISIIECKWFNNPNYEKQVLKQACDQIVPYAYDICFTQGGKVKDLLSKSLIALSYRNDTSLQLNSPIINCIGLLDLTYENWIKFIKHLDL